MKMILIILMVLIPKTYQDTKFPQITTLAKIFVGDMGLIVCVKDSRVYLQQRKIP